MDNTGPMFDEQKPKRKKRSVVILADIFIFVFIGAIIYGVIYINSKDKELKQSTTTTTTETTTVSTTTGSTESTSKRTFFTYASTSSTTKYTGTTKPKQNTVSGIVNDIKNGYNYYSLTQLENVGFKEIETPVNVLTLPKAKNYYYQPLLDGDKEVSRNVVISSIITINHKPGRTDINTRINHKYYSVNKVKVLKGYAYDDSSRWFNIYMIANDGTYLFSYHNAAELKKISNTIYDDIVCHPKKKNTIFYYVKQTKENNKIVYRYYNIRTNKEEVHDEINDAYDNGIIKIKTTKDVYINNVKQDYKYNGIFIDKNNINRMILSTDRLLYEYYYDNNTKSVTYKKVSDSKVRKIFEYKYENGNNHIIFLLNDNTELVRNNYYINEYPYDYS